LIDEMPAQAKPGEELAAEPSPDDVILPDAEPEADLDNIMRALRMPEKSEEPSKQITMLADRCRTTRSGEQRGGSVPYTLNLEILNNNQWISIISYEVTAEASWRYETTPSGSRKGRQVHLPARLAKQMAENDINKNWRQYAQDYNVDVS
jgi:hypothetical protein